MLIMKLPRDARWMRTAEPALGGRAKGKESVWRHTWPPSSTMTQRPSLLREALCTLADSESVSSGRSPRSTDPTPRSGRSRARWNPRG